jgi:hypothetical protein
MAEHELVGNSLSSEPGGVIGRCACGWSTGLRFSSMVASALFRDHLQNPDGDEPDETLTFPPKVEG